MHIDGIVDDPASAVLPPYPARLIVTEDPDPDLTTAPAENAAWTRRAENPSLRPKKIPSSSLRDEEVFGSEINEEKGGTCVWGL